MPAGQLAHAAALGYVPTAQAGREYTPSVTFMGDVKLPQHVIVPDADNNTHVRSKPNDNASAPVIKSVGFGRVTDVAMTPVPT